MENIITFLQGKKTFACCVLGVLVMIAQASGHLDPNTALMLYSTLGFGGLASHRAAVAKLQTDLSAVQAMLVTVQMATANATTLGNSSTSGSATAPTNS